MTYDKEIAECYRRIRLAEKLNSLLNHNPDFKEVVLDGFLHNEVVRQGLNINADKSGSVQFLKAASTFKQYLDRVLREAEQAHIDLANYQQLLQDAH